MGFRESRSGSYHDSVRLSVCNISLLSVCPQLPCILDRAYQKTKYSASPRLAGLTRALYSLNMGMSYSYYILLYTTIYDFCIQSRPSPGSFGTGRGGASLQGADLYRSLHTYFSDHCKEMRDVRSLADLPESVLTIGFEGLRKALGSRPIEALRSAVGSIHNRSELCQQALQLP